MLPVPFKASESHKENWKLSKGGIEASRFIRISQRELKEASADGVASLLIYSESHKENWKLKHKNGEGYALIRESHKENWKINPVAPVIRILIS